MKLWLRKWQQLSFPQTLWLTVAFSLLLSVLELAPNNPIDPDSITFINAAHAYWQAGWHAALQAYPWPFFPIACISLSHVLHLPLATTFHLINSLAQALLCLSFVLINRQLGAPMRVQKIAAVVILLYPFLNSIRVYATREAGYWAFALLAIYYLLRFMQQRHLKYAIAFGLSMAIAFLFRMEGLLMLIASPLAIVIMPHHTWSFKWRLYWRANVVFITLIGASLLYLAFFHHANSAQPGSHSRLQEYYQQVHSLLPHLWQNLNDSANKMGQAVLTDDSKPTAMTLWLSGLIGLCMIITIQVMKPILCLLALYGQSQRLIANTYGQAGLLYGLLGVNAAMLLLYTFEHYFLATRYPAFLTFLWLCWLPFVLVHLYDQYRAKASSFTGQYWFFPTLLALLIITALGGVVRFGYSKTYITEAGQWLAQHTAVDSHLYTNSKAVAFYAAQHNENAVRLAHLDQQSLTEALQNPCRYDWLALWITNNDDALRQDPVVLDFLQHHTPQKVFSNRRRDAVDLYDMRHSCSARD